MTDKPEKPHRPPDFRVSYLSKSTNMTCEIGAAWINESGCISVVIIPLVTIPPGADTAITLFPNRKSKGTST